MYGINAPGENQHDQLIEEKCTYVGRKKNKPHCKLKKVPPPLLNLSAINRKLIVLLFGFFIQTGTRDNLSEVDFSFNRQWVQKIQNEQLDINLTSVTAVR